MPFHSLAAVLAGALVATTASSPTITRLSGADRVQTALAIAQQITSPAINDNVLITSGLPGNLIDSVTAAPQPPPHLVNAITGAALAAAQQGVMVFTDGPSIPPALTQYLQAVHPRRFEILGGPASLPAATVSALVQATASGPSR